MGKAWISVLAAAALAAGWTAPARGATAAPALIAEVQTALDRGDAQQAAHLAETGLKESGISAGERAHLQLYHGLAQELLGASEIALRDFTLALSSRALPPAEQAQALLQRGFLRDGLGRLSEAAADYSAVIALKSDGVATALNNRANIYRRQSRWTEARADYQAALAAGGGRAQYSWYGLGQIAEAQGDAQGARGFYARAVAADPAYGAASQRLAALGGAPEGAIANPVEPIILRPPAAKAPAPADSAPPPARPVLLKSPARQAAAKPRTWAPVRPAPAPARSTPELNLRPALDQKAAAQQAARPQSGAGAQVQLGAWRTEAEALAGWKKARALAGAALEGGSPLIVAADLAGRGRYYRLRVTPAAGQSPGALCEELAERGIACFPARD